MILPRVKELRERQAFFFASVLLFPAGNPFSSVAIKLLRLLSPGTACQSDPRGQVFLEQKAGMAQGAYSLTVSETKIEMDFGDDEGLRNALVSLIWLNRNGRIPCVEIRDYPDNAFRSCMLDLARGYVELPVLREHLARLAMLKFNYVHFHLMDRQSYCLESAIIPNGNNHRLYSKSEMKELVQLCKTLGMTAIPEIEVPAHAVNLLQELPQLKCDIMHEQIPESDWVVCAGKESTYDLYAGLLGELAAIFDGPYFHIGGDELQIRKLGWYPNWDNCHACQALAEREQLHGQNEIYAYVIRRIHGIVKELGKETILWNDNLYLSTPPQIPTDVIIDFWHPGKPEPSPDKLNDLLRCGFRVIHAQYTYTYADLPAYMNEEKIRTWTPNEQRLPGILGGEMCAWELGNPLYAYYAYTLPVCMTLFSDRLWNADPAAYDATYRKSVFQAVSGDFTRELDPYIFFDELIPPREKALLEHVDCRKVTPARTDALCSALKEIDGESVYGRYALRALVDCVERIKAQQARLREDEGSCPS